VGGDRPEVVQGQAARRRHAEDRNAEQAEEPGWLPALGTLKLAGAAGLRDRDESRGSVHAFPTGPPPGG
jgi:hypothetical protein